MDVVPEIGQQLFVPSVAGLKGQFEGDLTRELVSLASLPEAEYEAAFYNLLKNPGGLCLIFMLGSFDLL